MLNLDNLAQHTQHHQELDESRNFVQEFLDTLDPSSAPQSDPGLGLVELAPDIVQKSPSTESKTRGYDSPQRPNIRPAQQQQQHTSQHQPQLQHLNQNQQLRQNKYHQGPQQQAHSNSPEKSKRKKVSKKHQESPKRTYHEPQPILHESRKHPVSTTRLKEGNGAVRKDDTRQSKKRKQNVDDVELGVQDLEIRDSHSTNKRKRQTEGAPTRPKGPTTATNGKQAKNRHVQDDQHASNQQDEDRPIRQNSNSTVKDNAGRKDSNKPRKILTQGSLIMNNHDNGNEFSEDAFLNQRTDSRESRLSGRRNEQVVTSAYFINAKHDDNAAASESSSSYGNKSIHEQSKRASTASSAHSPDAEPALQKRTVASTHHTNRHARAELPPQVNSIETEQLQQPLPVEHLSSAETYADSYTELQPYGYAAPQWQDPYRIMCDPLQQLYSVYDLPVAVLPACPTVPEQQLQHMEYYVDNDDTEYDHGLPLDGLPPQPLPPPSSTHFRWRPHRLF
ncbi:hypothetical protein KI688_002644 [Linnemannia hyalina]|uniref:Uncharacterized protein n=1 Tax=Linnemannia hyalina TaxID=64524 RepID=A0A9P8BRD9_9FUNG|nr:hypothetical protein KI688_002644 [Linnemannia hyalina]